MPYLDIQTAPRREVPQRRTDKRPCRRSRGHQGYLHPSPRRRQREPRLPRHDRPCRDQTPDEDTVVFKLKDPYASFSKLLASRSYAWIFPREAVVAYDPAKTIIGTGPFIWDTYTPDVAFTYKKNPDWFEKGKPYVDGVKVSIVPTFHGVSSLSSARAIWITSTTLPRGRRNRSAAESEGRADHELGTWRRPDPFPARRTAVSFSRHSHPAGHLPGN